MNTVFLRSVRKRRGFTITELLVVISIMGVLAVLIGQGSKRALAQSKVRQAQGEIAAITAAIEQYKMLNAAYPRPVGGSTDPKIQAGMLYQVLSGDGSDRIDGARPVASSDRQPGTESQVLLAAATVGRKKATMVHPDFYLIDPWGQPYRYQRGDEGADAVNKTTFDVWSEGTRYPDQEDDEEKWITNW